jgi:hypothetical protein
VVDSGATHLHVNSLQGVGELETLVVKHVRIANGDLMASKGMGMLNAKFPVVFMPSFIELGIFISWISPFRSLQSAPRLVSQIEVNGHQPDDRQKEKNAGLHPCGP